LITICLLDQWIGLLETILAFLQVPDHFLAGISLCRDFLLRFSSRTMDSEPLLGRFLESIFPILFPGFDQFDNLFVRSQCLALCIKLILFDHEIFVENIEPFVRCIEILVSP
jgi:hypothetical protein